MKKLIKLTYFLLLFAASVRAQNVAPAPPQKESVLIMNATAHLGNGKIIENSAIAFENGKLTMVADATVIRFDKRKYNKIIDAYGKHVYPGFIACNTTLGLTEIDLVRATLDFREVGELNPHVRSIIAYNTDSRIIPTVRSNGVLLAQIVPTGGILSGASSVVQLDAWNWEDAIVKSDVGIHLDWPRMYIPRSNNHEQDENRKKKMQKNLDDLEQLFREAKAYYLEPKPTESNVRFEAMKGLFDGSKKVFVHSDYIKEILAAVSFCERHQLKMVLVGGMDAWRATALLKEKDIPVILTHTHRLPGREDEDIDLPYRLPAMLSKAGITIAISVEGSWQNFNLMFHAGQAIGYNLSEEEAIRSITLSPAQILGIADRVGTLEEGKDATLFISSGNALDMRTNRVEDAFIQGRQINLDNAHKMLNRKYIEKYDLK